MKNPIIIAVVAVAILAGCSKSSTSPSSTTQQEPQKIVIRIGPSNMVFVADQQCSESNLVARISQLVGQQDTEVFIRGNSPDDSQVKLVAEACKRAGVHVIHYSMIKF